MQFFGTHLAYFVYFAVTRSVLVSFVSFCKNSDPIGPALNRNSKTLRALHFFYTFVVPNRHIFSEQWRILSESLWNALCVSSQFVAALTSPARVRCRPGCKTHYRRPTGSQALFLSGLSDRLLDFELWTLNFGLLQRRQALFLYTLSVIPNPSSTLNSPATGSPTHRLTVSRVLAASTFPRSNASRFNSLGHLSLGVYVKPWYILCFNRLTDKHSGGNSSP
jgi:hypothetical protein